MSGAVTHYNGKPVFIYVDDNIPDENVLPVPPANISSFYLFLINLQRDVYAGSACEVWCNSDMIGYLVEAIEGLDASNKEI